MTFEAHVLSWEPPPNTFYELVLKHMDDGPLPTSRPLLKLYTPPLYPLHSYDAAFILFLFKGYVTCYYLALNTMKVILIGSVLLIFLVFCVVLLCIFTCWVPCCDVRFDIRINTLFGSFLTPVVYRKVRMSYFRYLCLFVYSGVQHILCCVFVLFIFVLCTLCCQFLWIVHLLFTLRYSLTFIWKHSISSKIKSDRVVLQWKGGG